MDIVERPEVIWSPTEKSARESCIGKFAKSKGFSVNEYDALWRWSVTQPAQYWRDAVEFIELDMDLGARDTNEAPDMPSTRYFPDGRVNLAKNMIFSGNADDVAVVDVSAWGVRRTITYLELQEEVETVASWLISRGIGAGDVVATISPNNSRALVTFLATLAVGGTWTSCSPDFSPNAIIDRVGQAQPKIMFVNELYEYNGKKFNFAPTVQAVSGALESLTDIIVMTDGILVEMEQEGGPRYETYASIIRDPAGDFEWNDFPFDNPALIMYTSGTTGKPKAIVHSGGGILVKLSAEHAFHTALTDKDVVLWYTNIAWMMFHWLGFCLVRGCTIVLYDDAPVLTNGEEIDYGPIWRVVEQCGVTTVGISPGYLATLQRAGYSPNANCRLNSVSTVMTSGAPTSAEQFRWIHSNIAPVRISPISGGTELLSSFVGGSPLHVVRAGEMACKILGQAVDVVDHKGMSVIGDRGELVCTVPFPSMPLTFLGDGGDERYRAAYFGEFENIWTHGDLSEVTVSGGVVIHGRSDNTLNPQGVRIGTAEIYRPLEAVPEVTDAVVFGVNEEGTEYIWLCVKLKDELSLDEALASRIRSTIRAFASPRHVPAKIYQVCGIPYTQNGKKVEGAARSAASDGDVAKYTSLADPDVLHEFQDLRRMSGW